MRPGNMWLPNFDDLIKRKNMKEVTSLFIKEPSTNLFHAEGLFSEQIFGQVASLERLVKYGFISLKTNIIHPGIYERLLELNRFYEEIMSGRSEAVFDRTINDFVRLTNIKEVTPEHEVGTGYSFFLKHLDKIDFKKTESLKRLHNIVMLDKYKNVKLIDKFIVSPAGIRDYNVEDDKPQMEEINNLYMNILVSTFSLPSIKSEDPIWDSIRFNLQKKIVAVYQYFYNLIDGKGGFTQKKYTARSVALGTRNVLTGTRLCSYSSKDNRHNANETWLPLFQSAKAFQPLVTYYMNTLFFNTFVTASSSSIHVIDPKTYDFIQLQIDETDKKDLISREGLGDRVEAFRTPEIRHKPFAIRKNGKYYYLYLVYDDDTDIHLFRNLKEFSAYYKELTGKEIDRNKVRPFTNIEFLYVCTEYACKEKHVQTTRYPVLGSRNTYLSKQVVMTTDPDRKIIFINTLEGNSSEPFYHYPIIFKDCIDGMRIHSIWLKNLGGDHDGDTGNNIGILTKNANLEIQKYMDSKKYFLTPSGKLKLTVSGLNTMIDLTLKNICHRTFTD